MSLRRFFQTCLDLSNVSGAFCLSAEGRLIESFMPAPYNGAIFDELGPRLVSLLGAVDMSYAQTHEHLLRFETHSLYLRKGTDCIIGVYAAGNPLLSGLRVTVNMLLKQAEPTIAEMLKKLPIEGIPAPEPVTPDVADVSAAEPDEDVVIIPTKKTENPPEQKRGFFGRKKEKRSNDIWG